MALICMCIYATRENKKLKYVKKCLESMIETVDFEKNRLYIINNSENKEAEYFLNYFIFKEWNKQQENIYIRHLPHNIGTAAGINFAIQIRVAGEVVIKCDDDVTWGQHGWVEEMEQAIVDHQEIGICGLKRNDIEQHPKHKDPKFRTVMEGKIEWCPDIMGTCTAFNPKMLNKVGFMFQPSIYGYDDVLISVRSEMAGFRNCFLPHIKITHIDEGGTEYTAWKRQEAGIYSEEISLLCDMYRNGKLDVYYDGGFTNE